MNATELTLAEHWQHLASAALLGTDRRALGEPPPGPVAEVDRERGAGDGGERLLDELAVLVALRRGGVRPGPPAPLLLPAPPDPRPVCRPAAVRVLDDVLAEWPGLFDEWLALLGSGGWRLAPELVVPLLARFRADPSRRIAVAAGPLAEWLTELFPELLAPRRRTSSAADHEPPGPIPPDIARLAELPAGELAAALAIGIERAELTTRVRPSLVRLLCTVPAASLPGCAAALNRAGTNPATMGLALALADLATLRWTMIEALLP